MKRAFPSRRFAAFNAEIARYYREHARDMPWRRDTSPYAVAVSEVMLQQTQVSRVISKFGSWMKRFPDWQAVAKAPIKDVLQEWSGLGYNRRALYVKRIAEEITSDKRYALLARGMSMSDPERFTWGKRHFPEVKRRKRDTWLPTGAHPQKSTGSQDSKSLSSKEMFESLRQLPGIGPNTAGSIMAFAFNIPIPFIETNIRSVFIHFFFVDIERREGRRACKKISDDEIMPLIETALADAIKSRPFKGNPREWYWALMDYGSYIKSNITNPSRRSAHHIRQKPFKGSNRELRSKILRSVMKKPSSLASIEKQTGTDGLRSAGSSNMRAHIKRGVADLVREGFTVKKGSLLHIA